jgi:hypothetical protein
VDEQGDGSTRWELELRGFTPQPVPMQIDAAMETLRETQEVG